MGGGKAVITPRKSSRLSKNDPGVAAASLSKGIENSERGDVAVASDPTSSSPGATASPSKRKQPSSSLSSIDSIIKPPIKTSKREAQATASESSASPSRKDPARDYVATLMESMSSKDKSAFLEQVLAEFKMKPAAKESDRISVSSGDSEDVKVMKSPLLGESAIDIDSDDSTSLDGFVVDDEASLGTATHDGLSDLDASIENARYNATQATEEAMEEDDPGLVDWPDDVSDHSDHSIAAKYIRLLNHPATGFDSLSSLVKVFDSETLKNLARFALASPQNDRSVRLSMPVAMPSFAPSQSAKSSPTRPRPRPKQKVIVNSDEEDDVLAVLKGSLLSSPLKFKDEKPKDGDNPAVKDNNRLKYNKKEGKARCNEDTAGQSVESTDADASSKRGENEKAEHLDFPMALPGLDALNAKLQKERKIARPHYEPYPFWTNDWLSHPVVGSPEVDWFGKQDGDEYRLVTYAQVYSGYSEEVQKYLVTNGFGLDRSFRFASIIRYNHLPFGAADLETLQSGTKKSYISRYMVLKEYPEVPALLLASGFVAASNLMDPVITNSRSGTCCRQLSIYVTSRCFDRQITTYQRVLNPAVGTKQAVGMKLPVQKDATDTLALSFRTKAKSSYDSKSKATTGIPRVPPGYDSSFSALHATSSSGASSSRSGASSGPASGLAYASCKLEDLGLVRPFEKRVPVFDLRGLGFPHNRLLHHIETLPRYDAPEIPPNTPVVICHTASKYKYKKDDMGQAYLNLNMLWVAILADALPQYGTEATAGVVDTNDLDMGFL